MVSGMVWLKQGGLVVSVETQGPSHLLEKASQLLKGTYLWGPPRVCSDVFESGLHTLGSSGVSWRILDPDTPPRYLVGGEPSPEAVRPETTSLIQGPEPLPQHWAQRGSHPVHLLKEYRPES